MGCCLEPKGNGVNPGGGNEGGPGPQTGSKISSQPPAGKESTAPWSRKKTGRRVTHDKENPSCTERGLFKVLCKCSLSMHVNIIDIIKPLCTVNSMSYLLICFRRINHMAINHLHSSSDVHHHHVWYNTSIIFVYSYPLMLWIRHPSHREEFLGISNMLFLQCSDPFCPLH